MRGDVSFSNVPKQAARAWMTEWMTLLFGKDVGRWQKCSSVIHWRRWSAGPPGRRAVRLMDSLDMHCCQYTSRSVVDHPRAVWDMLPTQITAELITMRRWAEAPEVSWAGSAPRSLDPHFKNCHKWTKLQIQHYIIPNCQVILPIQKSWTLWPWIWKKRSWYSRGRFPRPRLTAHLRNADTTGLTLPVWAIWAETGMFPLTPLMRACKWCFWTAGGSCWVPGVLEGDHSRAA